MLDDIFANNNQRLRDLRSKYTTDTVASMINDRLAEKNINEKVTGDDVDGFLKITRLGRNIALVEKKSFKNAMELEGHLAF